MKGEGATIPSTVGGEPRAVLHAGKAIKAAIVCGSQLCSACLRMALLRPGSIDLVRFCVGIDDIIAAIARGERPEVIVFTDHGAGPRDSVLDRLLRDARGVPIVIYGIDASREETEALLARGVRGVVPGGSPPEMAVLVLQFVAAGGTYVPPGMPERARKATTRPPVDTVAAIAVEPIVVEPVAAPPAPARFTERQRMILSLVREGRTNKEIARALGLTQNTIKSHLARLMRRLGVANRVALARVDVRTS